MFNTLSWFYPTVVSILVLLAVIQIRGFFHKKAPSPPYETLKRGEKTHIKKARNNQKIALKNNEDTTVSLGITYRNSFTLFFLISLFVALIWVAWSIYATENGGLKEFRYFFILIGAFSCGQYVFSIYAVPYRAAHQEPLKPIILVPVYNESPHTLQQGIHSFFSQTVLPTEIHVVNDGSNADIDYTDVESSLLAKGKETGVYTTWTTQANAGKRAAQTTGFQLIKEPLDSIIITVDSDGILADNALAEGLKPFNDPEVQSVAGLVVSRNIKKNLLSRFTELIFVAYQQLVDRASMSLFGSVPVNSGGLAFYRYDVLASSITHGYNQETFGKAEVKFSDDSFLTLFAAFKGKTVFQPTSVVFADMPTNLNHHLRQQVRWARGSFIRGFWRIRYAPIGSAIFWRQVIGWYTFFVVTCILTQLMIHYLLSWTIPPLEFFLIPIVMGYIQSLRYFLVKRTDLSLWQYVAIWLMTPLATIWSVIVLRIVKLYSILTCKKTGWGTRSAIEIPDEVDHDSSWSAPSPIIEESND